MADRGGAVGQRGTIFTTVFHIKPDGHTLLARTGVATTLSVLDVAGGSGSACTLTTSTGFIAGGLVVGPRPNDVTGRAVTACTLVGCIAAFVLRTSILTRHRL